MSTTFVQDITAMRRGIAETHRRFEDAFDRGDAAGAGWRLAPTPGHLEHG